MRCPYCDTDADRVIDSRPTDEGAAVRRRRSCTACGERFSTVERVEQLALAVRKRDGSVEPYDRAKVAAGMAKATKNRDLDEAAVARSIARVEARVRGLGRREVSTADIGGEVLAALRELDHVAYLRFASVYKGFTTTDDFARELAELEGSGAADAAPG